MIVELTREQKLAIEHLAASALSKKFYWTGGTLLSFYYLKHRMSSDMDFFTDREFSFAEVNQWVQKFKRLAGYDKVSYKRIFDRQEFIFGGGRKNVLRVEFVYYNTDRITLKKRKKLMGVFIDSLDDIAANKTVALIDRNEPKDLFDIYFLIVKKKFSPERLLKLAEKKFGVVFDESLFWSEAFKLLPLLDELKPLVLGTNVERVELVGKINKFVKEQSKSYLEKRIL